MVEEFLNAFTEAGAVPAVITGSFGIVAVYLRKFNKDNTLQHEESMRRREEGHAANMALRLESKELLDDILDRIDNVRGDVREVKQDLNVRVDEVREDVKEVNEDIEMRVAESKQRVDEVGQRVDEVRDDVKEVRTWQQRHIEWHAQQNPHPEQPE